MIMDGGRIQDVRIKLMLSSRDEMRKFVGTARQQIKQIAQVHVNQTQQPQQQQRTRPHPYKCNGKENPTTKRAQPVSGGNGRFPAENATTTAGGSHCCHETVLVSSARLPVRSEVAPPCIRSDCVHVQGLPPWVTTADVTQFFGHASVMPVKVHVVLTKFGCPTGDSYCEFGTVHQARMALAKDQCYMGPNLVHVSPVSRSDMIVAIARPLQQRNRVSSRGVGHW
jgi:hypothetical protein